MCCRNSRAQISIEMLIISFFAVAIVLSLFLIYINMQNVWAGAGEQQRAQLVADRLAGAIEAVEQGIPGSEASVSLADAEGLELSVQGRSVWAAWASGGGKRVVSSPTFTDDIQFQLGSAKNVIVKKEVNGRIVVVPA